MFLNAYRGYPQHMRAAFQYHLKRRSFFRLMLLIIPWFLSIFWKSLLQY
jgi:hypothetical protein